MMRESAKMTTSANDERWRLLQDRVAAIEQKVRALDDAEAASRANAAADAAIQKRVDTLIATNHDLLARLAVARPKSSMSVMPPSTSAAWTPRPSSSSSDMTSFYESLIGYLPNERQ